MLAAVLLTIAWKRKSAGLNAGCSNVARAGLRPRLPLRRTPARKQKRTDRQPRLNLLSLKSPIRWEVIRFCRIGWVTLCSGCALGVLVVVGVLAVPRERRWSAPRLVFGQGFLRLVAVRVTGPRGWPWRGQVRAGSARIASRTVVKSVCQGQRAGIRRVHWRLVRVSRAGIWSRCRRRARAVWTGRFGSPIWWPSVRGCARARRSRSRRCWRAFARTGNGVALGL